MGSEEVLRFYRQLTKGNATLKSTSIPKNLLDKPKKNARPNSISIEEPFFGDSGKGRVTTEFNTLLNTKKKLYSLRFNGGANAGHEVVINGEVFTLHQLPMAVISEGATAIMSRGMLLHPDDFIYEVEYVRKKFNGVLPAKLIVDQHAVLALDTHRAYEYVLNLATTGGRGSTGRGISPGYMSYYGRIAVFVKDYMATNWEEIFRTHYQLYSKHVAGFGFALRDVPVPALDKSKSRTVGSENEFIERLRDKRSAMKKYVSNSAYFLLRDAWKDVSVPFTIEGAQGTGLDPYHGVYPDITASRTTTNHIMDSTYAIIHPGDIAVRVGVVKGPYMSSVGKRTLPTIKDSAWEQWIQTAFDERGRTSGRLRDIYPVSIPMGQYFRRVAGFEFLAVTHLDASRPQDTIKVITHYTDKRSKKESPYIPFQHELDKLEAHAVTFKGWDGDAVKTVRTPSKLPAETKTYLSFLSEMIAPVVYATTSPELGGYLSWLRT
jgi:adenylosuccinate synthase